MVIINIQVSPDLAENLQQRMVQDKRLLQIINFERKFGVTLMPLHPGLRDECLSVHFMIKVADEATAEKLKQLLLTYDGIDAAYVKPQDELP